MNDTRMLPDPSGPSAVQETFRFLAYPDNLLVFTSDRQGMLNFVSPSWSVFTGRATASDLGHGWLDHVHPHDLAALMSGLEQARFDCCFDTGARMGSFGGWSARVCRRARRRASLSVIWRCASM